MSGSSNSVGRSGASPLVANPTLANPRAADEGVRVRAPLEARAKRSFNLMLDYFHLQAAAADGVITRSEAGRAGVDYFLLENLAREGGDPSVVDSYQELAGAKPAAPVKADGLLARVAKADYILIAPAAAAGTFSPLLNHREAAGHRAAFVDPTDIEKVFGPGPEGIRKMLLAAKASGGPARFVLMAEPTEQSDRYFADPDKDGRADYHVGRLPALLSRGQAEAYISRLLAYEAELPPGLWQLRATLVDGDPMWGSFVGHVIDWYADRQAASVASQVDLRRLSGNPASQQDTPGASAVDGIWKSLLIGYVGHGGMGPQVHASAESRTPTRDGFPIMFFLSCRDGKKQGPAGEVVASGPAVAAIAAPLDTNAIANAQLSDTLGDEILRGKQPSVGEALDQAKFRAEHRQVSFWTWLLSVFVDIGSFFSRLFGWGAQSVRELVAEGNQNYNLFGDPALAIRRPLRLSDVHFANILRPGHSAQLEMKLPNGVQNGLAVVTLERPVGESELESTSDASLSDAEKLARTQRNHERYNQRVVATMRVEVRNGRPVHALKLPDDVVPGNYVLRVAVLGETDVATAVVENYPVENRTPIAWVGGL